MSAPQPRHSDRIVAVGLLTQRDIDVLGTGFRRLFPLESTTAFDELLRQLDACEGVKRPGAPGPR